MAVVRARSTPPYGLFAAVFFAVLAVTAAVVFYMMWNKATEDHDKLVKDAKTKADSLAQIQSENTKLAGDLKTANKNAATAKEQGDKAIGDKAQSDAKYNAVISSLSDATASVAKAEADKKTAEEERDQAKGQRQTSEAALAKQYADKTRDQNDQLSNLQNDANAARRPLVLENERLTGEIAKKDAEIFQLRLRITNLGGKKDVSVGEADGRVVRVNNTTGEVYINLGKNDRLMPGMPFTCYDPRTGVRFGTDAEALGNGSIEITQIQDQAAICRITRTTANRAIQPGDLISNIVYHNDKTRKFRFTVFGDFDLDGDGVATAAERERLVTLIKAWGGEVDDTVSSQTDYLVLGEMPKSAAISDTPATPAAPAATPADPAAPAPAAPAAVPGSVAAQRSSDQDRYEEMEIAARRLAIPVLNMNRFLAMVGYYNTTVVRY